MSDADAIKAEYAAAKRAFLVAHERLKRAKAAAVPVFAADMAAARRAKAAALMPAVEALLSGASLRSVGAMLGMKTQPSYPDVVYRRFYELVFTGEERLRMEDEWTRKFRLGYGYEGQDDEHDARLALARMRERETV